MRWNLLLDEFADDSRIAFRQIARNPGFTAIVHLGAEPSENNRYSLPPTLCPRGDGAARRGEQHNFSLRRSPRAENEIEGQRASGHRRSVSSVPSSV
jgi:hypothetical protein